MAVKTSHDFFIVRGIRVDDQAAVHRKQFRKTAEGVPDILDVLKEIQMIFFYIENDADCREKTEKAVGIFTCLRKENAGLADADISPDGGENAADTDSRIFSESDRICASMEVVVVFP